MRSISSFALIVFLGAVAHATPAAAYFYTGNELLQRCQMPKDQVEGGMCLGFIAGLADAINSTAVYTAVINGKEFEQPHACLRDGMTTGQLRDVVVKYLTDNAITRDLPADMLTELALAAAFPCSK